MTFHVKKFSIFNFQFSIGVLVLIISWVVWVGKGKERFTVIDTRGGVKISSFDPVSKSGFEMRLPDNMEIPGADDRGMWKASKIGQAGDSAWAARSVANYLGITYTKDNRYIWWWDRLRLKWEKIDMERRGFVEETKAVDGEPVVRLTETWKMAAREMFASEVIAQGGWTVGVINSSGEMGLAAKTADRIESMGVRVSEVKTGQEGEKGCWVEGQNKNKREMVVKIMVTNWKCIWRENSQLGEKELLLLLGLSFGSGER